MHDIFQQIGWMAVFDQEIALLTDHKNVLFTFSPGLVETHFLRSDIQNSQIGTVYYQFLKYY